MVKVVFSRNEDNLSIMLQGHACTAPKGKDLVCAALTMLIYTAAQSAIDMREDGKLQKEPTVHLDCGESVVTICPKPENAEEASIIFRTILHGYQLLENSYSNAVQVVQIGDSRG